MHVPTNFSGAAIVDLDRRAVLASTQPVRRITADQLTLPTPCTDWNLRDLLAHMTVQHRGFTAAVRGQGGDPANWHLPAVHDDPVIDHLAAADEAIVAFAAVDPNTQVEIAEFGPDAQFPASQAMTFHFLDYLVHGWDVAQALGQPFTPEPDLVDAGWQIAEMIPADDASRPTGGPFGPAVAASADASSFERLLAHVGRTPVTT